VILRSLILDALVVVGLAAVLPACGGPAFEPTFPEVAEPEFSKVLRALREAQPRQDRAVVVGIGGEPSKLFAWDLREGRMLWERPVSAASAPVVAGNLIVTQESDIVVRRLEDGEEAFSLDEEGARLVGADGDGRDAVITLAHGPEQSPHGIVVGARGTSVAWTRDLQLPVGVAAVSNGVVVVPWATQRISVLDMGRGGAERTRVRLRDAVVGHAFVGAGGMYVGQHGLFRMTESIETGTRREAVYYEPIARPLPGQPPLLRDGYEPVPPPDSARHRVRLEWRVTGEGNQIGLQDDNLYLVFYRYVFALDPAADEIRWVYTHSADLVGASVVSGGILLVTEPGQVIYVSAATGMKQWEASLGMRVQNAAIRPGDFVPEVQDAAEAPPLSAQLWEAASLTDARLAGGRALATRFLARSEEADVTGQLVELCARRGDPEPVHIAACGAVAERTTGGDHVRDALRVHGSFLQGIEPPPVGALAKAARNMELRALVPMLLEHLEDPSTPNAELVGLMEGLGGLGHRSAAAPIERFLRLYHAEAGDPALVGAAVAATHALAAVAGRDAEPLLERVASDPLAQAPVREGARAALAALRAPPPQQPAAAGAAEAPSSPPADTRPERVTSAMTVQLFSGIDRQLQRCLPEGTDSVRVAMLVAPDGEIRRVMSMPDTVQACIEPLVRPLRYPATRLTAPTQVVHTVRRTPATPSRHN